MPETLTEQATRPVWLQPLTTSASDDQAHDAARTAGFAAGYAAGARRAAADAAATAERTARAAAQAAQDQQEAVDRALAALAAAADAVRALAAPVLADATTAVHLAALTLAEGVLGVELADHERSAQAALARVLAAEPGPGPVTVALHPRDLAVLSALPGAAPLPDALRLVADPSLCPGDAVAHHADGHLDARVDAALARARDELAHLDGPQVTP
ncbi:hypothetical protein KIN34_02060 [Cellulomonas sp. DKR-3]|uniref:Flagellar assembly protein FliH/Type III secretion system HrpE domain-containing protein n=1 Tax=Cellulomonas fulva TaxID=2835530 RepID=A0ABS5TV91_9CELL|nr:FliH/SctL family protein [Cellulomonas fulva]MBT0993077.1 hypothetical protein [Cellulomonas fulva]